MSGIQVKHRDVRSLAHFEGTDKMINTKLVRMRRNACVQFIALYP